MDSIIAKYKATKDGDLMFCKSKGVAYQADMTKLIKYDEQYYRNYVKRRGTEIAKKLNEARVNLVNKYQYKITVLDIGIGSGEFIESRNTHNLKHTYGYDINRYAVRWLRKHNIYSDKIEDFDAVCFWDCLEHIPDMGSYLNRCKGHVFLSIPIVSKLSEIRDFKHYKPGEHLYYFTHDGIKNYMFDRGFVCIETNDMETKAGRESIKTYVFRRKTNSELLAEEKA